MYTRPTRKLNNKKKAILRKCLASRRLIPGVCARKRRKKSVFLLISFLLVHFFVFFFTIGNKIVSDAIILPEKSNRRAVGRLFL